MGKVEEVTFIELLQLEKDCKRLTMDDIFDMYEFMKHSWIVDNHYTGDPVC